MNCHAKLLLFFAGLAVFYSVAGFTLEKRGKKVPPVKNDDIDLPSVVERSEAAAAWRRNVYAGHVDLDRSRRRALADKRLYWKSRVIPYEMTSQFNDEQVKLIRSSMDEWEKKTCLTFRPRQESDENYVVIQSGASGVCNADQGMHGGKQDINLGIPDCLWRSTIQHELGHTIGLSHEHQHPNRDKYITLVKENVKPKAMIWMAKLKADEHDYFGMDFDMDSVMTYGSWANAIGKKRTMLTKDKSLQHRLDNYHKFLSYTDVAIVNKMEKCSEVCGKDIKCPGESYLDEHCKCITPQIYYETYCKDTGDADWCFDAAAKGKCSEATVVDQCTRTCDLCPMYHVTRKTWTEGSCLNKYYLDGYCEKWAGAGHCTKPEYRKFMVQWCSLSCNTCAINPDCLDTAVCDGYERKNCEKSSEYHDWMFQNCGNWCGYGPESCPRVEVKPTEKPTEKPVQQESECEDKSDECEFYDKDYCQSGNEYYPFMSENCRKWCGMCQSKQQVQTEVKVCADQEDCSNYEQEYCQSSSDYHAYMMDNCKKWCGACT